MQDNTPRYVPDVVCTLSGVRPVISVRSHPIGNHPKNCPLVPTCTAVEVITDKGSRWYGVEKAWINSELKFVVQGFNGAFEEMAAWKECKRV